MVVAIPLGRGQKTGVQRHKNQSGTTRSYPCTLLRDVGLPACDTETGRRSFSFAICKPQPVTRAVSKIP